jgi:membrane protein required for colicin V production
MDPQLIQAISIGSFEFNGFDTAVLVLLFVSALFAFGRGFLREIISILALVIAVILTLIVYGQFRYGLRDMISLSELADGILIFGTFAVTYGISAFVLKKMRKTIDGDGPGFLDRLFGAGFGVARGLVIASLIVMAMTAKHRASQEAQEFRDLVERGEVRQQTLETLPKSMREQMEADPVELPAMLQNSTFFPLLDRIGDGIRALPFADMRSYAERIKDGDLDVLTDGLQTESP